MLKRLVIKWAINQIRKMEDKELKREILTEAVKGLYGGISSEDILQQTPRGWMFEGRPITSDEVENLKGEARTLLGMRIWKVLRLDIRYQLSKKMFEEARCLDDILWGQLLTFLDDIIRTRLRQMSK